MDLASIAEWLILERPPNILWPPGYYILRDRIPFFLTIIYLYRHRIPIKYRSILGIQLTLFTALVAGLAAGLYLKYDDMTWLAGINWSAPSPLEWAVLILAGTITLIYRKIEPFTSFYMAFIAAMGGGWLYECPGWIIGGFWPMAFFKVNATKVFFIEFQLFCLPLLGYIITKTKTYRRHWLMVPLIVFAVAFYTYSPWLKQILPAYIGNYGYRWVIRLPVIAMLYTYIYGVKGEKN